MKQRQTRKKYKMSYYLLLVVLLVILYFVYQYYQENNFNDFIRSETNLYTSRFTRDKKTKYNHETSYQIENPEYNDAMFYKKVAVKKNQPYKVTCMVKTEGIESKEETAGVGAQLAVEGSTERSVSITGTQDWQKIELIFNSKDREEINIGARLGGNLGEAKGKAWFADFRMEEGMVEQNNTWKFACFIFKNTDITIHNKRVRLEVTENDVKDINNTINLFETSCGTLSNRKMMAECDIYQIDTPLTQLSYDKEFGYFVSAENVESYIKDTISNHNYDHIFVIVRLRR